MFRTFSLRVSILANFLIVIGIIASVLLGFQYHSSQQLATAAAKKSFEQIAEKLTSFTRTSEEDAKNMLNITALFPGLTASPQADIPHAMLKPFTTFMKKKKGIYSIYIGHGNKDFYQVINMLNAPTLFEHHQAPADTRWTVVKGMAEQGEGDRIKQIIFLGSNFELLGSRSSPTKFNPKIRPWFQQAYQSNNIIRTEPYLFTSLNSPGMTYAKKIEHHDAVLAMDITMDRLAQSFASENFAEGSEIFLFNKDGVKTVSSRSFKSALSSEKSSTATVKPLSLTNEEINFIQTHPKLTLSNESDWVPFDFNHAGIPRGYSIDLLTLLEDRIGIKFQYINGYTWEELLALFRTGELDVLQSAYKTKDREQMGIFTDQILDTPNNLITRKDDNTINSLDDMLNKTIVLPVGWATIDKIKQQYPQIKIITVPSSVDALKSVANREADATIDSPYTTQYLSNIFYINNIKVGPSVDYLDADNTNAIYILVQKDLAPLQSIFNKALASITEDELSTLKNKWFPDEVQTVKGNAILDEPLLLAVQDPENKGFIRYKDNGENYYAYVGDLSSGFNTSERLGIIIDAAIMQKPYMEKVYTSMMIALLALLISIPLILFSTSLLTKPIKALMLENEHIKNRQFEKVRPIRSNIKEYINLSKSLTRMSKSIQAYEKAQEEFMDAMIKLLAGAIDAKSPYTGGHCERVPEIAIKLAKVASDSEDGLFKSFKLSTDDEWREFKTGAWLHDCGKVTTPEYIVDKATKLETIYNRIHEVRTRFEVLWRDAEITCLEGRLKGEDQTELKAWLKAEHQQLIEDFSFIASSNIGGEFMSEDAQQRIKKLANKTWIRHFDDRLGLADVDLLRYDDTVIPAPATEKLLDDKQQHIYKRESFDPEKYAEQGFKLEVPEHLYNQGEIYNLCIARGTLNNEDRFKINEHIIMTIKMLESMPFPDHMKRIPEYAGTHHETMIGTGYPRKLSKDDMSIPARIMAIADIFEALTASDRPYKKSKTLSEAIKIMGFMNKDQHIDPDLFELFLRSGIYLEYAKEYLKEGQIDDVDIEQYLT